MIVQIRSLWLLWPTVHIYFLLKKCFFEEKNPIGTCTQVLCMPFKLGFVANWLVFLVIGISINTPTAAVQAKWAIKLSCNPSLHVVMASCLVVSHSPQWRRSYPIWKKKMHLVTEVYTRCSLEYSYSHQIFLPFEISLVILKKNESESDQC